MVRWVLIAIGIVMALIALSGCKDSEPPPVIPVDKPPTITLFQVDTAIIHVGEFANFDIDASDDHGIDSAIINYGDGGHGYYGIHGRKNLSAAIRRQYGSVGFFTTSLTIFDTERQSDHREVYVLVYPDTLPVPTARYIRR